MISQSTFDRCLIIFALLIMVLAVLVGCTPETAAFPSATEQYDEPVIGELSFAERPSPSDLDTPTINLILIDATLQADDTDVAIDGRGLETPLLRLNHCSSFIFDGDQIAFYGNQLVPNATFAVLLHYSGISLSTGGDNTRLKILTADDNQYQVPLALDTDVTFYTIFLDGAYTVKMWQGEQSGNSLTTSYRRPVAGKFSRVTLSEAHTITILHDIPLTYTNPIECD